MGWEAVADGPVAAGDHGSVVRGQAYGPLNPRRRAVAGRCGGW